MHAPDLPPPSFRNRNLPFSPPVGRQRTCPTQKRAASSSPQNNNPKVSRTEDILEPPPPNINDDSSSGDDLDSAENVSDSECGIAEVFETDLDTIRTQPEIFKSVYARRLSTASLNSHLTT